MSRGPKRRNIQIVGIVVMLAVTAEWAAMALVNNGASSQPTVAADNDQNTIWQSQPSGYPVKGYATETSRTPGCTGTAAFDPLPTSTALSVQGSVSLTPSGTCAPGDFVDTFQYEVNVTPTLCPMTCVDIFEVYSMSSSTNWTDHLAGAVVVRTASETGPGAVAYLATFTLLADFGTPSPSGQWTVQVVVSGQ